MRFFRYHFNLVLTFLLRFRAILIGSTIVGIAIFFFSSQLQSFFRFFERGEVIGIVDTFSMDNLPIVIQKEISFGLTRIDENNNVVPGLAEEWYSEDEGRTWIFKLGDYKWQDGSEVVAADINYNFSDAESTVLDKKIIKFTLKDPFAPFPSIVSKPVFKKGFVGVGEWRLSKLSPLRTQFTHSLRLINVKTHASRTYRFYPSQETARTAFKLGEVDKLIDLTDPKDLSSWENADVIGVDQKNRYVAIFFNMQDDLFKENKPFRQALAYAIKKDFGQKVATSPLPPNSWAFNPQVKQYQYNPQRAKELLLPVQKEKGNLSVNLVTIPGLLPIADKIKIDWEAIGVSTNIQVTNVQPENFQAFLVITEVPPDPDQYSLWHSKQPPNKNLTRLSNERIDKLLEDGRRTLDKEERKKIYLDFQRFLLEEVPFIPLFHPTSYTIVRK